MDLDVDFCPLLAQIQGYLLQHLNEDKTNFKDDLAQLAEPFAVHVSRCLSKEDADTSSVQSLHDLLLASSGLVPLDPSCPHAQSVLAKLQGARLPAALYLSALPVGLEPALLRRLSLTERPAELRAALVAAVSREPVRWPAVPPLLAACLQTAEPAADVDRLLTLLVAAPVTADGRPALALTACLLVLLEHLLESQQPPDAGTAAAAAAAVSAATELYRRVTLNEWLEWAERDAAVVTGGATVQAALSETLHDVTSLVEDARREGRAALLPAATDALLETVRPYAGQETVSRQERLRVVAERGRRSRRHFRALLDEFDVTDEELVRCLESCPDLIVSDDLWRLLTVLEESAGQPSELRDRVVKVLVAELLKDAEAEQRRRLVEHVLSTAPALRTSCWEQELRTASAQMAGGDGNSISETSVEQVCGLLLQSPRPLLHSLVQQTAESGGKATIMAALLPALNRRLPLRLLRAETGAEKPKENAATAETDKTKDNAATTADPTKGTSETSLGLIEALIMDQLSETSELKPFRQLTQLLVAAVGCQLTAVDERLAGRVTALPVPKRLTLHLVQELLGSAAPRSAAWCCPLAQFAAVALDETLDLDSEETAPEAAVDQRQRALHCFRLLGDVDQLDATGALSALSRRCHPVTQQYVSRLLLRQSPPVDHDPLLLCLTEEAAPAWHPDQHTLIKATLASYLPYLCEDEWRRLHDALLQYSSGRAPLAGQAPAEQRPLARSVWYYGDLMTLWTTAVDGVTPEESLLLAAPRVTVCLRAIAVQVKRSLERLSSDCPDEYCDELSAVFLPLTHLMTLVSDPAARDSLDMLALYVTAEFIKQLTSRMEQKSAELPPKEETPPADDTVPVSPCMDWELQQMDASASTLSQFVVGCFNIPNDSPVKKRVLQHISGSVLGSLTPQQGVAG
ncbi:uncharacterized protein LOC122377904 [Amphibalanus amphitrite]|uniref:uncharacterized protein LOC122377904 n=1 Tax=Amphibalanus amphitrite TaxID=1232801 RepID=UPI001C906BF8|nr:uncharacterized protein LOC122377904 [Amphibalanus amphitrite]